MIKIHVHPPNKMLTLTLRVTQKLAFPPTKIKTPSLMLGTSLSKILFLPKREYGLCKNISMPKSMREKRKNIRAKEHETKKEE
jgi:hypothetical protein